MKTLIGGVVAALLPGMAMAEFTYTLFDVSYVDAEFDSGPVNVDGDGYEFEGALDLTERLFLRGALAEQSFDFDIDTSQYDVGVGLHHALSPDLDFVGTASYVRSEVEAGSLDADDDGLQIGGGIRTRIASAFQLDASLQYVNFDDGGSDTGIDLRGRYYFSDQLAVGLQADFGHDVETMSLGFRAEF